MGGIAELRNPPILRRPTETLNVYAPSVELPESVPLSNEVYRREAIMFAGSRQQLVVMIHESLSNGDAGGQVWDALLAAVVPAGEA